MSRKPRFGGLVAGLLMAAQAATPLLAADPPFRIFRAIPCFQQDVGRKPATGQETCIEDLARNIDWLEHQIDVYGTVTPKVPDVWGEARLTAHRQEFENELRKMLGAFVPNQINGAQFVSDQSFLAFALSVQGKTGAVVAPPVSIATANGGSVGTDASGKPAATLVMTPSTSLFSKTGLTAKEALDGIALEQTETIDQLADYINHLHERRRINEGDDTSDAPGYAMNLVRIPISVLPGSATKHGYGAEITITAEPYLGPELLPMAFRDLVINDLVEQLALTTTRFLNNDPAQAARLKKVLEEAEAIRLSIATINTQLPLKQTFFQDPDVNKLAQEYLLGHPEIQLNYFDGDLKPTIDFVADDNIAAFVQECEILRKAGALDTDAKRLFVKSYANMPRRVSSKSGSAGARGYAGNLTMAQRQNVWSTAGIADDDSRQALVELSEPSLRQIDTSTIQLINSDALSKLKNASLNVSLPASTLRKATLPFPPSQTIDVYGLHEMGHIVFEASDALRSDLLNREVIHLTDVQALLREELGAAYELLQTEEAQQWWEIAADGKLTLYKAIRQRNQVVIDQQREVFLNSLGPYVRHHRSTAALAWCVYVESVLLNERLIQDMRETFGNQPKAPEVPAGLSFFGPNPCPEARAAFAQYVRVRWPIHVFNVDPANSEQNISDVSSVYRQMQMAVALAFSQQKIGCSAAMQTMRMLQRDRATFDLNRTIVGFGHGDDTFGWKFYPRFQTPPVQGNAVVFFRDLVSGGPTDKELECGKKIEPGQRECMAIVLMPSFVPHVTFHTRSDWFRLGCASRTASSVHDTMQYSRVVKQMEVNAMQCGECAHLYRDGELDRLMKRVHQLDRKLALQTLECQVPIENTHGGFEIFSAGTRAMAPELTGWYGAPGYDPTRPVNMFLSGDNFGITSCKLIAGNQEIPFRLLSRQIMEVTLPAGLPVIHDPKLEEAKIEAFDGYIDAHIATPYGVSGHLLIPAVRKDATVSAIEMSPQIISLKATYGADKTAKLIAPTPDVGPLAVFSFPPETRTGTTTETISFQITCGVHQLSSVDVTLPINGPGRLVQFNADDTLKQLSKTDADATIAQSLNHFLTWLVASGSIPSEPIEFRVTAALKRGGTTPVVVPISGSMAINVTLTAEPAAKAAGSSSTAPAAATATPPAATKLSTLNVTATTTSALDAPADAKPASPAAAPAPAATAETPKSVAEGGTAVTVVLPPVVEQLPTPAESHPKLEHIRNALSHPHSIFHKQKSN